MRSAQLGLAQPRVPLVEDVRRRPRPREQARAAAVARAAVAHPVLDARRHREGLSLEPAHLGGAERRDDRRVLGEALVRAPPAQVVWHRDARREDPIDAARERLRRRHARQPLDQRGVRRAVGVAHAAEADVVREERRVRQVVLAVHAVVADQQRHARARARGGGLQRVVLLAPAGGHVGLGRRPAATEHRAECAGTRRRVLAQRPRVVVEELGRAEPRLHAAGERTERALERASGRAQAAPVDLVHLLYLLA